MTKKEIVKNIKNFLADETIPEELTGWSIVVAQEDLSSHVQTTNVSVQDFLLPVVHYLNNLESDADRHRAMTFIVNFLSHGMDYFEVEGNDDGSFVIVAANDDEPMN